ncbi:unnamed protein product [Notodromas monacha]|uniref:Uncharacterized protein n=1 Tax=Notodromas monacha TaxID=399045 RepID=A0A7R9GGZ7_9CRUS|nr:unnamed protein product [Notodromas monacha]CAG0922234.1 unnamed protein product [Notodromas monacha]
MATECFWGGDGGGGGGRGGSAVLKQLNVVSSVQRKDELDSYISLFAEGYLGRNDVDVSRRRHMWDLLDSHEFGTCPPCDAEPRIGAGDEPVGEAELQRRLNACRLLMPLRVPLSVFSPYICPEDNLANVQDIFAELTGDEDFSLQTLALPWIMRPVSAMDDQPPKASEEGSGLSQLELFLMKIEIERRRLMEENPGMDPCELKRLLDEREEQMWLELKTADGVVPVDPKDRLRRLRSRGVLMERVRWKRGNEQDALYEDDCGGVEGIGARGAGCTGMPSTRSAADIACQRLVQDRVSDVRSVDKALKVAKSPSLIMEDDQGLLDWAPCSELGLSKPPRPAKRVQNYDQDNRTEHAFSARPKLHARRTHHWGEVAGNPYFCRKVVECRREPSVADMKDLVKLSHEQGKLYKEYCGPMDDPPSLLCSFFTKLFCPDSCCTPSSGPSANPRLSTSGQTAPCPRTNPRPPREPTPLESLVVSSSVGKGSYPFTSSTKVRPRRHTIKYCWSRNNTRLQETFKC